jgi:hypothetical protein
VSISQSVAVFPPYDTEMVTKVGCETLLVEIGKVAWACPAATETLAGTVAAPTSLLASESKRPAEGAAPTKDTDPMTAVPPVTMVGGPT